MPWQPGQSGNPNGRPKGKKDQFVQRFWNDLSDAWKASGADALARVIEHNPSRFISICASVLPRNDDTKELRHQIEVTLRQPDWLTLDQPDKSQVIDITDDNKSD